MGVMKMNSALVIFIILSSFVAMLNVSTVEYVYSYNYNSSLVDTMYDSKDSGPQPNPITNGSSVNPCQLVEINIEICQIYWVTQMIFSVFFLVWNLLVAVVLVSVARTQTINIRRFLKELEHDAILLNQKLQVSFGKSSKDDLKNFIWMNDDHIVEIFEDENDKVLNEEGRTKHENSSGSNGLNRRDSSTTSFPDLQLRMGSEAEGEQVQHIETDSSYQRNTASFEQLSSAIENAESVFTPHIMSEQEIMLKYWKISMNVRLASIALQRWMSSIVGMIAAWSAIRMVYWLSHSPTWYGIFLFIVPLLLLPLMASSYAEVNYEGIKVLQSILPTDKRVPLFQYLYGLPIQMTVYGHAISYGTIGTVVAGILAAFASKILFQEIQLING